MGYFLVKDSDRLARNTNDYAIIRDYLKKHGCKLVYVSNPDMDSESGPEQKFMDGVLAYTAEFYS